MSYLWSIALTFGGQCHPLSKHLTRGAPLSVTSTRRFVLAIFSFVSLLTEFAECGRVFVSEISLFTTLLLILCLYSA